MSKRDPIPMCGPQESRENPLRFLHVKVNTREAPFIKAVLTFKRNRSPFLQPVCWFGGRHMAEKGRDLQLAVETEKARFSGGVFPIFSFFSQTQCVSPILGRRKRGKHLCTENLSLSSFPLDLALSVAPGPIPLEGSATARS